MQQWYILSLWCGDRWEVWWRFQVSSSASLDTLLGTGTYKVPSRAVTTAVTGTPNVPVSSQTTSVTMTHYSCMNAQAQNKRSKEGTGIWVLPIPRKAAILFWRKAEILSHSSVWEPDFSGSLEMCPLFIEHKLLPQLTLTQWTMSMCSKMRCTLYLYLEDKKNPYYQ